MSPDEKYTCLLQTVTLLFVPRLAIFDIIPVPAFPTSQAISSQEF